MVLDEVYGDPDLILHTVIWLGWRCVDRFCRVELDLDPAHSTIICMNCSSCNPVDCRNTRYVCWAIVLDDNLRFWEEGIVSLV